jgi:hypothetical protein
MPGIPACGGNRAGFTGRADFGCSLEKVHGSRRLPHFTLEAPDHAVHDAFIRRSVRARYLGCAPREAASRRMIAKQFRRSGRARSARRHWPGVARFPLRCGAPHTSRARCSAAHRVGQHTVSGKDSDLACVAGRAASRHGRTIDDDARNYERNSTCILIFPQSPVTKEVVPEKWGKYDKFISTRAHAAVSACGRQVCRYANLLHWNSTLAARRSAAMEVCATQYRWRISSAINSRSQPMSIHASYVSASAESATRKFYPPPAFSSPRSPSQGR